MSDDHLPNGGADGLKKKKRDAKKARGVWISFAGRIVAQIVGAAASVGLGVYVLQRAQQPSVAPTPPAANEPARIAAPRKGGDAAIAVLPLTNLSNRAEQEYFVDGMTEAITAGLTKIDGLRVISRTSTLRYKREHPGVPEIARALGVDLVIEGSVLQADDQVRITAQLIDGPSDEHLWAQSYTRALHDVIALQDEVATAIASAIQGTVRQRPSSPPATRTTVDPAAYDLYLRGRHAWFMRTPESMEVAVGFLSRAVERDPTFALAHAGLADAYALQGSPSAATVGDARTRMEKARVLANRALELDGGLAEAHTALGAVLFFGDRDFPAAEKSFRRAIQLNPNYSVAHEWLGILLSENGRDEEARRSADTAVSLDPFEATMYQARGLVHYYGRRFKEAADSERRALELLPQLPLARALLVKSLTLAGDAATALKQCDTSGINSAPRDLRIACTVAWHRAGDAERAAAARAALAAERSSDAAVAQVDAGLGEYDCALRTLTGMAARGSLPPNLAFEPLFDGLRARPEWSTLAPRLTTQTRP